MTKEEIREGIAGRYCYEVYGSLLSYIVNELGKDDYRVGNSYKFADSEMEALDSQGVVLKCEGELPVIALEEGCEETCHRIERDRLIYSGYTKTERLI